MNKPNVYAGAIIGIIALILWCAGAFYAGLASKSAETIPVRLSGDGVTPAALSRHEELLTEDGAVIPFSTLWREFPGNISAGLNQSSNNFSCRIVEIYGYGEDVVKDNVIGGWFPAKAETTGCVISEKTAFDLWQSSDVLGKTVYLDGEPYTVLGVTDGKEGLMLTQTFADNTEGFGNMVLRIPGGGTAEVTDYLRGAGFGFNVMLDLPVLGYLIRVFSYLPALFIALAVIIRIIARWKSFLNLHGIKAILILGASAFIILGAEPLLPRLIPSAWSDFGFYGSLFGSLGQDLSAWLSDPSWADMALITGSLLSILLILLSVIFTALAFKSVRAYSLSGLTIGCVLNFGVIFAMTFAFSGNGGLTVSLGMWLAGCLWIASDYVITNISEGSTYV